MRSSTTIPITPQRLVGSRRQYNAWVADETMEDYALRYTPRGFRKWSEWRVANTAFGSLSFLALEAIGGAIAVNYGFGNAVWAILVVGLIIFFTGVPIAYYAARYGLDMDLLTRGAGFGYLGSTITSFIYAVFTFIFFALEAVIMAQAIEMVSGWPTSVCYLTSSLVVMPLAMRGITLISKIQAWTQPLWLFLLLFPFVWIALNNPDLYRQFTGLSGMRSGSSEFSPLMFGAAAAVIFSLVVQIGEQVDILRFLPPREPGNWFRWWAALLLAGPGWIFMGMLKMLGGAFLGFAALQFEVMPSRLTEPTQMYWAGFKQAFGAPGVAIALTVVFVILSQVKINITNAYAGSLAWSNFFARVTRSHPGRVVWLVFNVCIATLLMLLGVFNALDNVLSLYSNVAIAWVGALVADLVINKPLGLSPKGIEFRRAYLYDFNPVGMVSMIVAAAVAVVAHIGWLGDEAAAFSPFIALGLAMLLAPMMAWLTRGRYYIARQAVDLGGTGSHVRCQVCDNRFERADMVHCPAYQAPVCSLCCSLESRCHDRCKQGARASEQVQSWVSACLPATLAARVNSSLTHYLLVLLSMVSALALTFGVIYVQESLHAPQGTDLSTPFLKVFVLLVLLSAVVAWWVVLTAQSRRVAQDESEQQTALLTQEISAHQRTDAELQAAKDRAESASQAKTRYVAGLTHELRTPLTSIMGYAHALTHDERTDPATLEKIKIIRRASKHMHALIDGSLDLARIESSRLRLDVSALHLPTLLDDVQRMIQPQAQAKGLDFSVDIQGETPQWIRADAKRLRQILINLLSNGVRYTTRGGVRLRLDFQQQVTRIEVIDTGMGIAEQDQRRIFLPFERGSAGRRQSEPGTGLGLTIVHLLTDMMGGDLQLYSVVGQGTTFTLRLYLPKVQDGAELAMPERLGAIVGYEGRRRTLLLVDDTALHRQLLAGLLAPLGFGLLEAASGEECLEVLRGQQPDLLLMDITMDGIDGWETAAMVRQNFNAEVLPIVFVSANWVDQLPLRLEQVQCQGFLPKPVLESQLHAALERNLQLQWVRSTAATAPSPEDVNPQVTQVQALSPSLRLELAQLARQGRASALSQRLLQLKATLPASAGAWQSLQAMLQRLDFDGLVACLCVKEDGDA